MLGIMFEIRPQDRCRTGRSSYRKLLITLAVLVSAGLLSGIAVGVAAAAPEPPQAQAQAQVRLLWVKKGGVEIEPTESIEILAHETNKEGQPGVEIVLEVWVIPPQRGLHMFGFSLRWDEDGRNELEFVRSEPGGPPGGWGDLSWDSLALAEPISSKWATEENPNVYGEFGSYVVCHQENQQCAPESGETPITLDLINVVRITFRANSTASADTDDIRAIFKPNPEEWWSENDQGSPEDICPGGPGISGCGAVFFGSASVVPEPGGLGMQLAALTTLAGLLSARRRG
jgi:hypothetical protein